MMNDFNLNLDDYELQDILNLFSIELPITFEDLKQAKKTVLKLHPDKSQLPSQFFIFYGEALKVLVHLYSLAINPMINAVIYKELEIRNITKI